MSAAAIQATVPHYQEARTFWDEFTSHCEHQVQAINAVVEQNQLPETARIQLKPGPWSVSLVREAVPSTEIQLNVAFEQWGPRINGSVRGEQEADLHFYPQEFDFAIGSDLDNSVVAITPEGGSLSPHKFAKFMAQHFRRCYPGITLPSSPEIVSQ
jgi:hypothetical protein